LTYYIPGKTETVLVL